MIPNNLFKAKYFNKSITIMTIYFHLVKLAQN